MEKTFVKVLAISAVSVLPACAFAASNEGFYAGAGVSSVRQDWDDTSWTPMEIFGGYKHSGLLGAEIRLGGLAGGDDPKLENYQSIYYRPESSNSVGKTYLLLGYSRAELGAFGDKFTFDGFSYGAGVGFVLTDNLNLNLEYKVLADGKGSMKESDGTVINGLKMKLSSVSATLDYRFDGTGLSLFSGSSSSGSSDSGGSNGSSSSSSYDDDVVVKKGPYVFGDIAQTTVDGGGDSESVNGFSVGAGYRINNTFAVETAYRDMGSIDSSGEDYKSSIGFSTLQVSGVAYFPINDLFNVYGRLGIAQITIDVDEVDEGESYSDSESKTKAIYGVGARYTLNDKVGLRLELNKLSKWESISWTTLALGVDYSF